MTNKKRKVLATITKWSSIVLALTTLVLMVAYSTAGQKELQVVAIIWLIAFLVTVGTGAMSIVSIVREPN